MRAPRRWSRSSLASSCQVYDHRAGTLIAITGTQGKIERYHRTIKNVVELQHYYFPWDLEAALRDFVAIDIAETLRI